MTTPHPARRASVDAALNDIRAILAEAALDRATLARISTRLEGLAAQAELFRAQDFPPPEGKESSTRYRLNPDDGDDDIALYLNAIKPGKSTVPHNHTTWAVIVALEGEELNRVYRAARLEAPVQLELEREVVVQPGQTIAFLPDDIHSIHVGGATPTLHFHLYGRPLETLDTRIGIDLEQGRIINYNASELSPSVEVRA